jgi:GNAT superfamily N-acetyltransferase
MEFTIRNMMEQDKQEVLDMMRVFYASPAVQSNGSDEIFENDIRTCIEGSPYLEGYVFENDGQLLGYAMAAKSFSTEFGKQCVWIEDLYMKPESRGLGIGSKFFEYIEESMQTWWFAWKWKKKMKEQFMSIKKQDMKYCHIWR